MAWLRAFDPSHPEPRIAARAVNAWAGGIDALLLGSSCACRTHPYTGRLHRVNGSATRLEARGRDRAAGAARSRQGSPRRSEGLPAHGLGRSGLRRRRVRRALSRRRRRALARRRRLRGRRPSGTAVGAQGEARDRRERELRRAHGPRHRARREARRRPPGRWQGPRPAARGVHPHSHRGEGPRGDLTEHAGLAKERQRR